MALNTNLTCKILSDPAQLEAVRPLWASLLERSAVNEPVLTPAWLLSWWRIFGHLDGRQLRAALFYDGDRLVALAPLLKRRHWYRPGIPFQRLELIGAGEDEEDEICSEYLSVIAERGAEREVARGLVAALASGAFGGWDEFILPDLNGEDALVSLLAQALDEIGVTTEIVTTGTAPYIPLPATWDEYLNSLSSSKRYFITRSLRDFNDWAGGDVSVECVTSRAELEESKRTLIRLHNERWGTGGQSGAFGSPRFSAFHELVMSMLLEEGALELMRLNARGEPVAALYNIVWNGKVYFYQGGRKTNLPKAVRPGVVIHAHAIRRAIEAGRREYDLLSGQSQFKMKFALATRPVVKLRGVRRSLLEPARQLADYGISRARAIRDAAQAASSRLVSLKHLPTSPPGY